MLSAGPPVSPPAVRGRQVAQAHPHLARPLALRPLQMAYGHCLHRTFSDHPHGCLPATISAGLSVCVLLAVEASVGCGSQHHTGAGKGEAGKARTGPRPAVPRPYLRAVVATRAVIPACMHARGPLGLKGIPRRPWAGVRALTSSSETPDSTATQVGQRKFIVMRETQSRRRPGMDPVPPERTDTWTESFP